MKTIDEIYSLLAQHPKAELGFFPTPLQRLGRASEELGVEFYIKRDDFSGRSLFGGNKMRKLQYLLGEALERKAEYVFTFGATQSNHAMQTATSACACGLKPVLYLESIVAPDKNVACSNLLLDSILGAEVHIVPDDGSGISAEDRSYILAERDIARREAAGHRCYSIPMGGASPVGSMGFIEGWCEMERQLGRAPDYVCLGSGTGGTLSGLAAGKAVRGAKTTIFAIEVSKHPDTYAETASRRAEEALAVLGEPTDVPEDSFTLCRSYYQPGYEIPNQGGTDAIRWLARTEGIFADPVYSGKALYGTLDKIRSGEIPRGSTVVFWHTGGATALFAEPEIVGDLVKPDYIME